MISLAIAIACRRLADRPDPRRRQLGRARASSATSASATRGSSRDRGTAAHDEPRAVPSSGAVNEHSVTVPGGTIYYRTEGSGPPLVLIGGGPSNADTLAALAGQLAAGHTVVTYDRRGLLRAAPSPTPRSRPRSPLHTDDVRRIIDDLGAGPASVFATSVGALIGLELAAAHPAAIAPADRARAAARPARAGRRSRLVRPRARPRRRRRGARPDRQRASASTRGRALTGSADRPEARREDIELFIHRDVAAIAGYRLDIARITSLANRIVVTAGEDGRAFYPHRCAEALACRARHTADRATRQPRRNDHPPGRVRRAPRTAHTLDARTPGVRRRITSAGGILQRRMASEPKEHLMDWTLEVVILPVSDIDRSVAFYRDQVGFELDHDTRNEHMHVVQLTPRGSGCSIVFGDLPAQCQISRGVEANGTERLPLPRHSGGRAGAGRDRPTEI